MPQQLLQSIEQLRHELDQHGDQLDQEQRTEMLHLLQQMESALADEGELNANHYEPLIARLKDQLWQFEKAYPTLTVVTGRILDNLSRMGI